MEPLPVAEKQAVKDLAHKIADASNIKFPFKDGTPFTVASPEDFKAINSGTLGETLKIMTYNVANFQDHANWEERCKVIAVEIDKHAPDLIGIQEMRYSTSVLVRANAVRDLLIKLKTPYYCLFQSAMDHGNFLTKSLEGLTILSKHPIEWFDWQKLPNARKDLNRRIKLTVRINPKTAKGEEIPIEFTNTHFTYDVTSQEGQAEKMRELLDGEGKNQILVGDFNTQTQDPMWPLVNKTTSRLDFSDCHKQKTFPAWDPVWNLDKILYRGDLKMKEGSLVVQKPCESKEKMDSDHLYVITEFYVGNS